MRYQHDLAGIRRNYADRQGVRGIGEPTPVLHHLSALRRAIGTLPAGRGKTTSKDNRPRMSIVARGTPFLMKICIHCDKVLPLEMFYKHPSTADGRLNKCIDCAKAYQTARRNANLERERALDRKRKTSVKSPEKRKEYKDAWKSRNQDAVAAHRLLNQAVRSGRIVRPAVCSSCGETSSRTLHGHHEDYAKPYDVVWLCHQCHGKQHRL